MTERKASAAGGDPIPENAVGRPVMAMENHRYQDLAKLAANSQQRMVEKLARAVALEMGKATTPGVTPAPATPSPTPARLHPYAGGHPASDDTPDPMPAEIRQELDRHIVTTRSADGLSGWRGLSPEGCEILLAWQKSVRDAWRPDDISEADQWPEPLRTVVSFRLLVSQYVGLSGDSMNELPNFWKRGKLLDLFSPMVDDVAAALLDKNEDPKELFRVMPLANERDQTKFADKWRGEVLPTLRTLELKLRSRPTIATTGETGRTEASELSALKPCERKAYLAHQYAELKLGRRLTDREAWEYLDEHGIGDDGEGLTRYDLLLDTFGDYMNRARRKLGEPKYTPRGGRADGARSVRKRSDI